jgi:tRNA G18 (ribose-2'-O)-methylase SpoU
LPTVYEVATADDPRLRDYAGLTDVALRRRFEPEHGIYLAESEKVIRRALAAGHRPRSLLMSRRWYADLAPLLAGVGDDVPVYVASDDVVTGVTGFHVHRGALAAMRRPAPLPVADVVRDARRLLVLEGTVDHTNCGAAFRSAAALGFDAVLLDPRAADPLYRRAVRVSMGAVFDLPWTRLTSWPGDLDRLRSAGVVLAALSPDPDAVALAEFARRAPARLALLVGTEGPGLSEHARRVADLTVQIPMAASIDSLNVAAAVAVACYALGPASTTPDRSADRRDDA